MPLRPPTPALHLVRRGMLTAAFGLALVQGSGPVQAATPEPQHDIDTAASNTLNEMTAHYNSLDPTDAPILVFDPDRINTLPEGHSAEDFAALVARHGLHPTADAVLRLKAKTKTFGSPYLFVPGLEHTFYAPMALADLETSDGRTFCGVVASDHDFAVTDVGDLTDAQSVRFFNRHEFWHCLGDNLLDQNTQMQTVDSSRRFTADYYRARTAKLVGETRADLGAVADMVALDGDDISVISSVAIWRARRYLAEQHDLEHFSTPALSGLKDRIEAMGIENFRALDDAARGQMVEEISQSHRLTPAMLALMDEDRFGVKATHMQPQPRDRQIADAIVHLRSQAPGIVHLDYATVTLDDQHWAELEGWNVRGDLLAAAGEQPSRHDILAARAQLLNRIREDLNADPENPLHGARIILLKNTAWALAEEFAPNTPAQRTTVMTAATPAPGRQP